MRRAEPLPEYPERNRKSPGKKNTNRRCKGVVGREHQFKTIGWPKGYERPSWRQSWTISECQVCGKQPIQTLKKKERAMPDCPVKTPEQREHDDRWERVAGKELKDWVTRVMKRDGLSRKDARMYVLNKINSANRPWGERMANIMSSLTPKKLDENKA